MFVLKREKIYILAALKGGRKEYYFLCILYRNGSNVQFYIFGYAGQISICLNTTNNRGVDVE